jgi:hypothetical protein
MACAFCATRLPEFDVRYAAPQPDWSMSSRRTDGIEGTSSVTAGLDTSPLPGEVDPNVDLSCDIVLDYVRYSMRTMQKQIFNHPEALVANDTDGAYQLGYDHAKAGQEPLEEGRRRKGWMSGMGAAFASNEAQDKAYAEGHARGVAERRNELLKKR